MPNTNPTIITIKNGRSLPPTAGPVKKGDTVRWINNDGHSVTVNNFSPESPFASKSLMLSPGPTDALVTLDPPFNTNVSYTVSPAGAKAASTVADPAPIIIVDTTGGTGGSLKQQGELAGVGGSRR